MLESFRSLLRINSNLILNKNTCVLKLQSSGDKYFKEFLIPFFIKYPLFGNKFIKLFNIVKILKFKESNNIRHLSQLKSLWDNNIYDPQLPQLLQKEFLSLAPIKSSHNSKIITVINIKDGSFIKSLI